MRASLSPAWRSACSLDLGSVAEQAEAQRPNGSRGGETELAGASPISGLSRNSGATSSKAEGTKATPATPEEKPAR